jgi:formylglycine-generating enzyme
MKYKISLILFALWLIVSLASAQTAITSNDQWSPVSKQDAMGTRMVQVPAGSFVMGSGSSQTDLDYILQLCNEAKMEGECERSWFEDELNGGTQTFTEPFWIDETEVTRAAYEGCVNEGICEESPADEYSTSDTQPINNVTWYQAATYCKWRGARLPTEAEWEYAARGPDGLIFPWGNNLVGNEANHCDSNCANTPQASDLTFINLDYNDGYAVTSPVGSYPNGASWVGALDMAGNVWEWTRTQYKAYPYNDDVKNFLGDEQTVGGEIASRGGSFFNPAGNLPTTFRGKAGPGDFWFGFGFRCVRSNADF